MKPYGVNLIECPDVADIHHMGSKGCVGKLPGKSRDYHPYSRGQSKNRTRQYWKGSARREAKAEIAFEVFRDFMENPTPEDFYGVVQGPRQDPVAEECRTCEFRNRCCDVCLR